MRIRRWMAAVIVAVQLIACAAAEELPGATAAAKYAPANMSQEEVHGFVEQLFAAVTGTNTEAEKELRTGMTEEEIEARNAANAEYRAKTLPWLTVVFRPELTAEEIMESREEIRTPEPTVEATVEPVMVPEATEEPKPEYTTEDSWETFEQTEAGREYLAQLEGMGAEKREKALLVSQEICAMWMAEVEHAELSEMNGDYRCWIYAPGTQIDYPVVQSEDNSKYLKRMFNGARNSAGTLFVDYRNLPEFEDPNTLIYGHHMRNDSMFGTLTDYGQQAYYEGHPYVLVMSEGEIFVLELFAGYTTTEKDHCYDIAISDEEDMQVFVEEAMKKSDFKSGAEVQTTDRLVTLSTCAYAFENARYILIGRIVPVWNVADREGEYEEYGSL